MPKGNPGGGGNRG